MTDVLTIKTVNLSDFIKGRKCMASEKGQRYTSVTRYLRVTIMACQEVKMTLSTCDKHVTSVSVACY